MDFVILQWHKLDTLGEFMILFSFVIAVGVAIFYVLNRKKIEANEKIDEKTIKSYKEALDATKVELGSRLDHCETQHKKSQTQIDALKKENADLQGQIKILSTLPLEKMTNTLDNMSTALLQHIKEDSKVQKDIDKKLSKLIKE